MITKVKKKFLKFFGRAEFPSLRATTESSNLALEKKSLASHVI